MKNIRLYALFLIITFVIFGSLTYASALFLLDRYKERANETMLVEVGNLAAYLKGKLNDSERGDLEQSYIDELLSAAVLSKYVTCTTLKMPDDRVHYAPSRAACELLPNTGVYSDKVFLAQSGDLRIEYNAKVLNESIDVVKKTFLALVALSFLFASFSSITGLRMVVIRRLNRTEESLRSAVAAKQLTLEKQQDLLMSVSHEIRTPLNSLNGAISTLQQQGVFPEKTFQAPFRAIHQIERVVEHVSKMNGANYLGFQDESIEEIFPERFLKDCLEQAVASSRGMVGSVDLFIETSSFVTKTHLQKCKVVVTEIILNALRFTNTGEISITADLVLNEGNEFGSTKHARWDGIFRVSIRDTGIGISPNDLTRIFEPYYQVRNTLSRAVDGTGLGLAICASILQGIGGKIVVDSASGEGTTVTVEIPSMIVEPVSQKSTEGVILPKLVILSSSLKVIQWAGRHFRDVGFPVICLRSQRELEDLLSQIGSLNGIYLFIQSASETFDDWIKEVFALSNLVGTDAKILAVAANDNYAHRWPQNLDGYQLELLSMPVLSAEIMESWEHKKSDQTVFFVEGGGNDLSISFQSKRVLIVDDVQENLDVAKAILEKLGCECEVAINGQEAIKRQNEAVFDLILMDIQMPVMDGLTAAKQIRKRNTVLGRDMPKIVAVSAYDSAEDIERSKEAGMLSHIAKPLRLKKLVSVLEEVM